MTAMQDKRCHAFPCMFASSHEQRFALPTRPDHRPPSADTAAMVDEPVVGYGPFVMNSREEIAKAIEDFNTGKFGRMAS